MKNNNDRAFWNKIYWWQMLVLGILVFLFHLLTQTFA